jgi:hypothetical protein
LGILKKFKLFFLLNELEHTSDTYYVRFTGGNIFQNLSSGC